MRLKRTIATGAAAAALASVAVTGPAGASSHREAPQIAKDPVADVTDVYAFRDAGDPSMVNLIANFIPGELPQAGPNYYGFGEDVLYELHVDNDGDVATDISYQFRFRTELAFEDQTFLYNVNQVTSIDDPDLNIRQYYSVRKVTPEGSEVIAEDLPVPPVNVGVRSTPDYQQNIGAAGVMDLPGGAKVFAGPRDDPFFVDLGSAFDLLGLRPLNPAHLLPLPAEEGRDGLAGYNVHSIALQLPIEELNVNGEVPQKVIDADSFIGVWSSTSRQQVRTLSPTGDEPATSGPWIQIARLGLPLVNEVLIPLGEKDEWNYSDPVDDAQYFPFILDPEPARLIPVLYPGVETPPGGFYANGNPKRFDIVAVLNGRVASQLSAEKALPPADLLRVNLAVDPSQDPAALGLFGGDPAGFPNGRQLENDVVDIMLRLLAGGTPLTPKFNVAPNNQLTDGVDANDAEFLDEFPYLAPPFGGYSATELGSTPVPTP